MVNDEAVEQFKKTKKTKKPNSSRLSRVLAESQSLFHQDRTIRKVASKVREAA